jgi:hypothetical protein
MILTSYGLLVVLLGIPPGTDELDAVDPVRLEENEKLLLVSLVGVAAVEDELLSYQLNAHPTVVTAASIDAIIR